MWTRSQSMSNTNLRHLQLLALGICAVLSAIFFLMREGKSSNSVPLTFRPGQDGILRKTDDDAAGVEIDLNKPSITVGIAICGDRLEQSVVMLKSFIIFSRNVNLRVIAFQDNSTSKYLQQEIQALQESAKLVGIHFNFEIYDSWFPQTENDFWRHWFAPCSTQRLFYPFLLPYVGKILHLDSDVLILTDILNVWNHFKEMDRHDPIAAMAPEHMPPGDGWYNTQAKIPYCGPRGLNAGVMLMNLEAMRKVDFTNGILLVYEGYKENLVWADQDVMNVYFHFHKSWLHELPCDMNYLVQFCHPDQFNKNGLATNCTRAEENGISILHGNRKRFDNFEITHNIFMAFKEYQLELNTPDQLLNRLKTELLEYKKTGKPCSYLSVDIFKNFQRYIDTSTDFAGEGSMADPTAQLP